MGACHDFPEAAPAKKAPTIQPASNVVKDTLSVVDNRTGVTYEL